MTENGVKRWSNHKELIAQIKKEKAIVQGWEISTAMGLKNSLGFVGKLMSYITLERGKMPIAYCSV